MKLNLLVLYYLDHLYLFCSDLYDHILRTSKFQAIHFDFVKRPLLFLKFSNASTQCNCLGVWLHLDKSTVKV